MSGVITQGRYAGGQGEEFAEQVTVQVSLSPFRAWKHLLCHKDTEKRNDISQSERNISGLGLKSASALVI